MHVNVVNSYAAHSLSVAVRVLSNVDYITHIFNVITQQSQASLLSTFGNLLKTVMRALLFSKAKFSLFPSTC